MASEDEPITLNGQATVWSIVGDRPQSGIRYIPKITILDSTYERSKVDSEVSFNAYATDSSPLNALSSSQINKMVKFYRTWARYSTAHFEARAGLQKINFGPAKIFRPLMWFDRVDPRDPLQLTDGVYAMLLRYYFPNNANMWAWTLYKNEGLKGLEIYTTDKAKMEFGGRYQLPAHKGEFAFTFHQRQIDISDWRSKMVTPMTDGRECRYALDGMWDIGIGVWFEAAVSKVFISNSNSMWQKYLTIGGDYTFDIGTGLHVLGEHLLRSANTTLNSQDYSRGMTALEVDYNLNVLDTVKAIEYYDWNASKLYSYIGWQRTLDDWMINLSYFSSRQDATGMFGGNGIMAMITYNH